MNCRLIAIAMAIAIIAVIAVGASPTKEREEESIGSIEDMIDKYLNVSRDLIRFQLELKQSIAESWIYLSMHAIYYDGVNYPFMLSINNIHRDIVISLVDNDYIEVREYPLLITFENPSDLLLTIIPKKNCGIYNVKFYRNCLAAYSLLTDHLSDLSPVAKKIFKSLFKYPVYEILNEDDLNPWDIDQSSIDDMKECSAQRFKCIALLDYITKVGQIKDHQKASSSSSSSSSSWW